MITTFLIYHIIGFCIECAADKFNQSMIQLPQPQMKFDFDPDPDPTEFEWN